MRISKKPDVRRAEIMVVANELFQLKGYAKTSVDEIVQTAKIAKGTFYYYFKSKDEILDALAKQLVLDMAQDAEYIVDDENLDAIEKLCSILGQQKKMATEKQSMVEGMHLPENKVLHERINIETVRVLGPVFAKVVEQGNREGQFQVDDPLSTVQFILAGAQFLLGHGNFNWSISEEKNRNNAMFTLIERAFAAKPGAIRKVFEQVCS